MKSFHGREGFHTSKPYTMSNPTLANLFFSMYFLICCVSFYLYLFLLMCFELMSHPPFVNVAHSGVGCSDCKQCHHPSKNTITVIYESTIT